MLNSSKLRILVVDDEPGMRQLLRVGLTTHGHIVSETDCGMGALQAVRRHEADLIILDLGLPDLTGLQVIKRIRYALSYVPIIVVSSRGDEASKVAALDRGADDYITKPFGIDELLARVRVLQRYRVQPRSHDATMLKVGAIKINLVLRDVTVRGNKVKLSPREYELLRLFVIHAGKVLTHGFIMREVWGTMDTDIQYLRIYIRSLRQKLEVDTQHPSLIITEPGVGYRLRAGDETVVQSNDNDQSVELTATSTAD